MEQDQDWNMRIAHRVGQEVARARERTTDERGRKLSAQTLADRCAKLGHPLDRSVIAKLEKGIRQSVSVADLLVLAKALGMPPLGLVFPVGYDDEVEAIPGRTVHPVTALRWASGEGYLPGATDEDTKASEGQWRESAIFWVRKLMKDEEQLRNNHWHAAETRRRAGIAATDEAREAWNRAVMDEERNLLGQRRLVDQWHRETQESKGIKTKTPRLYGAVPVNLVGDMPPSGEGPMEPGPDYGYLTD